MEKVRSAAAFTRAKTYFIAVAATILALAQFSEAVTLIESGIDWTRSKFTHNVEYELLDEIQVGNTQEYLESLIGYPRWSKKIEEGITAGYYLDDKYLLTVFLSDERLVAYTVYPLVPDFSPTILESADEAFNLSEFTFSELPNISRMYILDHSKVSSYYIESVDAGISGFSRTLYLGTLNLNSKAGVSQIAALYDQEVNGSDQEIAAMQQSLRDTVYPNFFGWGVLDLDQIRRSLISGPQFSSYVRD